ncbi:hypothetical protein JCM16161A_08940 [Vulcanisaeta sp. JCM 16161]|uniref:hypothetical protein n=1 Tax=Vulcanisaeta sp. JCM 16161 TaxID=1295372 RepID=UPI000AC695E9|nr:hypothetical protein [Vulcanisaeta sp. JCM 16161]
MLIFADVNDIIGGIVNDVDFVMWNIGNMYNTFMLNILTALTSIITIVQLLSHLYQCLL